MGRRALRIALPTLAAGALALVLACTSLARTNTVAPTHLYRLQIPYTVDDVKDASCSSIFVSTLVKGITGTSGADLILATSAANSISGGNGDDCILGGGGNDTINGGLGNDVCIGGPGTDTFSGCEVQIQ